MLNAQYTPVIRKIEVDLLANDGSGQPFQPEGGKRAYAGIKTLVKVSNTYEIDPDNLKLAWSPDPGPDGLFAFGVRYEANISIQPGTDGKVGIRIAGAGQDYIRVTPRFFTADNLQVLFNGVSDETVSINERNCTITRSRRSASMMHASIRSSLFLKMSASMRGEMRQLWSRAHIRSG